MNIHRIFSKNFYSTIIFPALLLLFFLTPKPKAQNLAPNPGFEEYLTDPQYDYDGVNESVAWFNLGSSTDFFHRMYAPISGIPANFRGYQEPAYGDGCAGLISWPPDPREYLAVQLIRPLEAEVIYEVSFKVNLSNACRYASDDIGVAFFPEEPIPKTITDAVYHVKNTEGKLITDTVGWTLVQGYYTAAGGEHYMVIGDFYPYNDTYTDTEVSNRSGFDWVYFYIDDVVVQQCSDQYIEQIFLDTTICAGNKIQLQGLSGVEGHYWEGFGIAQSIEVDRAGVYIVNNFTVCNDIQQIFTVETPVCDCSLQIPSVQLVTDPLRVQPSFNVQSYYVRLFDSSGRMVLSFSDTDLDKIRVPPLSAIYFWQAELSCLDVNDLNFRKTMGGKVVIVDY